MVFGKKIALLLIPFVALSCALSVLTSCGKKRTTTDCEQMQIKRGERNLTIGFIAPGSGLFGFDSDTTLVVYLHGLGANWHQPFFLPWKHTWADAATHFRPGVAFMSPDYGAGVKWLDKQALDDITSSINAVIEKFPCDKIVITGCSMGASSALSYTVQAPEEIRKKIVGVVAMYPAGDFVELHEKTTTAVVKSALEQCFGGAPDDPEVKERYLAMSVLPQIDKFPGTTRVYVMSATEDATIPPILQTNLVEAFKARDISVELEHIKGPHEMTPSHQSYSKALKFVLQGH